MTITIVPTKSKLNIDITTNISIIYNWLSRSFTLTMSFSNIITLNRQYPITTIETYFIDNQKENKNHDHSQIIYCSLHVIGSCFLTFTITI